MKGKRKGQVALEFSMMVMLASIFLVLVAVVATFFVHRNADEESGAQLEATASMVQQELLLAASAGEGYQRRFTIPDEVYGRSFTIENDEGVLLLTLETGIGALRLIPNATGTLAHGSNRLRLRNGTLLIDQS